MPVFASQHTSSMFWPLSLIWLPWIPTGLLKSGLPLRPLYCSWSCWRLNQEPFTNNQMNLSASIFDTKNQEYFYKSSRLHLTLPDSHASLKHYSYFLKELCRWTLTETRPIYGSSSVYCFHLLYILLWSDKYSSHWSFSFTEGFFGSYGRYLF